MRLKSWSIRRKSFALSSTMTELTVRTTCVHTQFSSCLHPEEVEVQLNPGSPLTPGKASQTIGQVHGLSPTSNRITEEISDVSLQEEESARPPLAVKMPLFHDVQTGTSTAPSVNELNTVTTSVLTSGAVVQPNEGTSAMNLNPGTTPDISNESVAASRIESPIKKSKLKEKEN